MGVLHYGFDDSTVVMEGTKIKRSCDDSEYDGARPIGEGNSFDASHSKWFKILAQFVHGLGFPIPAVSKSAATSSSITAVFKSAEKKTLQ